jgi:diguanylate cyclase (GGDEF)-like protein
MLLNLFQVQTSDKELAMAVRVALLKALFESPQSLSIGAFLGCAMAGLTAFLSPSPWIVGSAILVALTGIARVVIVALFKSGSADDNTATWEFIYEAGALAYAGAVGMLTFFTIVFVDDIRLHLMTATMSTAWAAGATGHNTGRPLMAVGMLLACAFPLSVALLVNPSLPNILLSLANLLFIAVIIDITLRTYKTVLEAFIDKQEKLRLATVYEKLSKTDPLTGIDNRTTLKLNLEHLLAADNKTIGVFWLDLDRFKQINDSLGHNAGDVILHAVASRLALAAYPDGKLARFGGDEFIIAKPVDSTDEAIALAEQICHVLNDPVVVDNVPVDISVSIGIAISGDGCTADEMLRHADMALYEAKSGGRDCVRLFDPEMERRLLNSKQIERDLKRAIANDELDVYFQPVIDLKSMQVRSFEALVRWHHPVNGDVPPSIFIPIAETSNSIGAITEWVMMRACACAAKWPNDIAVAVNISAALLTNRELPTMVSETLLRTGLPPRRLNLEITETALVEDHADTRAVLENLKALGASLSLDDFGTGYSSLSLLCRYRFDVIKIDRSFLANVHRHSEARAVIQAISSLASSLDLTVVAEGIETLDQLIYITDHGCAAAQGYYFARPMPGDRVVDYLNMAQRELSSLSANLRRRSEGEAVSGIPHSRVA